METSGFKLTTIIPTYNRAHYIKESIDSVVRQCRIEDEIIVVDDGSTDNTLSILEQYGNRIRVIRQENSGPSAARNRGIMASRGNLIAFQDSDDVWTTDKVAMQIDFFTKNPEIDFLFGEYANFIDGEKPGESEIQIKNPDIYSYLRHNSLYLDKIFDKLLEDNFIPTPTVVIKKTCFDRIGYFDESLTISEDYDLWLRAACHFRFGFIDSVLLQRRRHDDNLISDFANRLCHRAKVLTALKKDTSVITPDRKTIIDGKLSNLYYDLGSYYFKRKQFIDAYKYLSKCSSNDQGNIKWRFKIRIASLMNRRLFRRD